MSDCTTVTSEQHLYQTIVQFDETIELPRKLATGNIHDYLFWYCPLVGILFEVLRIVSTKVQVLRSFNKSYNVPLIVLNTIEDKWKIFRIVETIVIHLIETVEGSTCLISKTSLI